MAAPQNVIALVFDFDDTLTDDSTTQFLESKGINKDTFWKSQWQPLIKGGWNPALAYLKLFLDIVGEGKPLGSVTNQSLRDFGGSLAFYPGIPKLFDDLKKVTQEHKLSNPSIEFYIVSGGFEEIIKGSAIAHYFSGIWGCRLAEDGGQVRHLTQVVTFTEKTRYLFEINKGVNGTNDPYEVNRFVAKEDRRIPFENMIYVGDGLTDVPCFSLVQSMKGQTFGVLHPGKEGKPKMAVQELVGPKRVGTVNSPKFGEKDDLGSILRAAVKTTCMRMDLKTRAPLGPGP